MTASIALFGGRFEVLHLLGEGSFGRVYAARDRHLDLDVAVKTLSSFPVPDDVYLLKQEFRSACDLVHPHLVRLYGLFVQDELPPHFSMELLSGPSFEARSRALAQGQDWPGLERLFLAVAEGLDFLHQNGWVHRDVKPSNVRLRDSNHPVILDFGLTATLTEPEPEVLGGSLAYAAPEQLRGDELSPAADWYAFGVMLFEALTGRLPGPVGTKAFHVSVNEAARASPSRAIGEILLGTLNADSSLRLDGSIIRECLSSSVVSPRPSSSDVFVGREDALSDLHQAFARVRKDGPRGLVIRGPSGVGKTTLLRRFLSELPTSTPVLSGRSHPQESLSFRGLDEVIDQLARQLSAPAHPARRQTDLREASRIYPGLRRALEHRGSDDVAGGANRSAVRRRAQLALVRLLDAWAEDRGGVIWLDDVQWADADSGDLLQLLLELGTSGILICLVLREDEMAESRLLDALQSDRVEVRALNPFTGHEVQDFLRTQGLESPDDALGARAREQTRGLPYLLHILTTRRSFRTGRFDLKRELEVRLSELSAPARRLLETLALSGRPLPLAVALAGADIEPAQAERGMAELVRERWARRRRSGAQVELEHNFVREATLRDIGAEARKARHFALARAWLRAPEATPDALVSHFAAAGREREAVGYALRLASEEAERFQFRRAAELYTLAAELGGHRSAAPWELLARAAEALAVAGQHRAAGEVYARSAEVLHGERPGVTDVVELRRRAAESFLKGGHVAMGLRLLKQVLETLGIPYPKSERAALISLVWLRLQDKLRPRLRPRANHPVPWKQRLRIDACYTAGMGLSMSDSIRSAVFQARFSRLALRSGQEELRLRALTTRAAYLASEGGRARRRQSAHLIAELERRTASGEAHADLRHLVAVVGGVCAFFAGDFERAVTKLEHAVAIGGEISEQMRWETSTATVFLTWARIYMGRIDEVRGGLEALVREARSRGNLAEEAGLCSGLPNLTWLADGDVELAAERSHWSGRQVPAENTSQLFFDAIARGNHALFLGRGEAAHALIEALWPALDRGFLLRLQWVRIELWSLRARAAHAALRSVSHPTQVRRLRKISRTAQRTLRQEDLAAGPILAELLDLDAAGLDGTAPFMRTAEMEAALRQVGLHVYADALRPESPLASVFMPGLRLSPAFGASQLPTGDLEPAL